MRLATLNPVHYLAILCVITAGCEYSTSGKLTAGLNGSNESSLATLKTTAQIQCPAAGDVIHDDTYDGMSGLAFALPPDHQLVVFASDRFNYFLMYPFPRYRPQDHFFEQKNIRLATEADDWELHVCVASRAAASYLTSCARKNQWSFSELPAGVQLLDTVRVERRKR